MKAGTKCVRCGRPATDQHHVRGKLGPLRNDPRYKVPMCRKCHTWVHANPNKARKAGLLATLGQWNRTPKNSHRKTLRKEA